MDILGPDRGKITIYGSDFQQVNLTPNGGVSPTDYISICLLYEPRHETTLRSPVFFFALQKQRCRSALLFSLHR